jgi:hypothetical protein
MAGKLLNLTFHGVGVLTGEDLRFKEAAVASGLVKGDAMDDIGGGNGPKPFFDANKDKLLHSSRVKEPSGVDIATLNAVSLVTFNRLGRRTWQRDGYRRDDGPSIFEQWLTRVFAVPVEVLVLAGHHSNGYVWGSEVTVGGEHRPFSGLYPTVVLGEDGQRRSTVEMFATSPSTGRRSTVAGPFDVTNTLKTCRMVVVFGCNGATSHIAPWRDAIKNATGGRAPFIFGVRGVHSFPRDAGGQFLSPRFWSKLEALAPGSAGNKNLDFLHDNSFRDKIIALWRDVMNQSFPKSSPRRHLFFADAKNRGPRGAGAVDPAGKAMWVINAAGDVQEGDTLP